MAGTASLRPVLLPAGVALGTLAAGIAALWLLDRAREAPLEARTRDRLAPRPDRLQPPGATAIGAG